VKKEGVRKSKEEGGQKEERRERKQEEKKVQLLDFSFSVAVLEMARGA
jgi:hypothetical protein